MTKKTNNIHFPEGCERSIRNRLGLAQLTQIDIGTALELAKVHKYQWDITESEHWAFKAPKIYSIHTGDCKSGWYTQNFDLGVNQDGMVTHIVENRGYPPDFGVGEFLASMFRFGNKDKDQVEAIEAHPKKTVEFPTGKETQIRHVLGLADSDCFEKNDIFTLAKFHGYTADTCSLDTMHLYETNLKTPRKADIKPGLDIEIDNEHFVRSIVTTKYPSR